MLRNMYIKKFTLRISTLYICWFLVNLIINFDHTKTNNLIINLILGNTFPGSWFYSALIISTLIIFGIAKTKKIFLILFSLSIYIYIIMNFSGLCKGNLFNWYQNNIYIVFLSLPYALIWTTIGYLINVNKNKDLIILNIILVISFILLSLIYKSAIIEIVSWYIRLILSEIIAYVCINYNLKLNLPYKYLRNMSTLIFMIHFSFLYRLPDYYLYHINLKFFIATLFSLVASIIIIQLSKFKYLTILHRLY